MINLQSCGVVMLCFSCRARATQGNCKAIRVGIQHPVTSANILYQDLSHQKYCIEYVVCIELVHRHHNSILCISFLAKCLVHDVDSILMMLSL